MRLTVERGGRTVARLPFVVRGPRTFRVLTQPPLTPFLGPWITPEACAKYVRALGDQMELQALLEARLPAAAAFHQNFPSTVTTCLPFIWAGYRAEVRYTYGSKTSTPNALSGTVWQATFAARSAKPDDNCGSAWAATSSSSMP